MPETSRTGCGKGMKLEPKTTSFGFSSSSRRLVPLTSMLNGLFVEREVEVLEPSIFPSPTWEMPGYPPCSSPTETILSPRLTSVRMQRHVCRVPRGGPHVRELRVEDLPCHLLRQSLDLVHEPRPPVELVRRGVPVRKVGDEHPPGLRAAEVLGGDHVEALADPPALVLPDRVLESAQVLVRRR